MNAKKPTQLTEAEDGSPILGENPSPRDRGQALKWWIKNVKKFKVGEFAKHANIHPATLARYFAGDIHVATIPTEMADKLLEALGISDDDAWELLKIPEENKRTFRSWRTPPLGHGPEVQHRAHETLAHNMLGEINLPAGVALELEPASLDFGIQIIELDDGRFYSVSAERIPADAGRRRGRLVAAYFLAQPA